jgi:O-glycosyl hydrolase
MRRSILIIAAIGCNVSSSFAGTPARLTVDAFGRFQSVEGWGTSMIGWDLGNTPYQDPRWRNAYRDLGMNILRVPMSKEVLVHSTGDMTRPVVLGTSLQSNVNLMNFDAGALPVWGGMASWLATNAIEPDRVKIVGSVWSPPHWMKGPTGQNQSWVGDPQARQYPTPWLSGQHNPWGPNYNGGDSIGGRLRTENSGLLQQYGRYLAAWVTAFEQEFGVPIYAMSLQNESLFENPFDSMTLGVNAQGQTDLGQYALALKAVKDAWTQFGIDTKIKGPHHAQIGPTPQSPWALNGQIGMIQGVKNHPDPTLLDFLDFYGSNYYMGVDQDAVRAIAGYYHGSANVPGNWASWANAPGLVNDGKGIWYSETGDRHTSWSNSTNSAIQVALKMHNALVHSDASAYIYWQMSDGGWGEGEYTLLGQANLDNPHASKKYSAFKQFSRYVRPGADRVSALFGNGLTSMGGANTYDTLNSLNVSAFVHDDDGTATVVLVNMRNTTYTVTLDVLSAWDITSYDAWITDMTRGFDHLGTFNVIDGTITFDVPRYSVVTLLGVAIPEPSTLLALTAVGLILRQRSNR